MSFDFYGNFGLFSWAKQSDLPAKRRNSSLIFLWKNRSTLRSVVFMRRFQSFRPEYRLSVRLSRCSKTCAYKSSIITLQISTEYVLTLSAAKTLFSQKWIHSSGRKLCFLCPKLEYLTLLANINVMAENTVKRTNDVGESRGKTCHMITAGLFLLRPAFADRLNLLKSLLV